MAAKTKPTVGMRAWEVEWCAGVPKDENGDSDMDRADDRFAHFKDKGKALAYARKVLPNDAFGAVRVTPIEFVPYDEDDAATMPTVGFWEHSGESIIVDE